ncbi:MAG: HAD family hydrolase [Alphaproteobacteria bacterium]|nr:HAD family hydrolase [Alphaproteobacteria bacterium]
MVTALTFDLWDTLVVDDSDEEVRAARGLLPKALARPAVLAEELRQHHDVSDEAVRAAWEQATATFRQQWKVEHRTPHVRERVREAYGHLGLAPTPGFERVVEELSRMEVAIAPRPTDGVVACLRALHGRYPLGIVSDAIVTPGSHLRILLQRHGLLDFFDFFVFSDEVGASKPDPAVFHAAAAGLRVDVQGIVHVGDREANDIAGPIAAGARGVLYTGAIDRGTEGTRAAVICRHLDELPGLVDDLAAA